MSVRLCLATFVAIWLSVAAVADTLRMAVTTSFKNSGLSDILLPAAKEDLGIEVQLLVVGTGQALRLGRSGDVDAILVHSRAAEEEFVADGHATHRREIMYNDYVIVGPRADPVGVSGSGNAPKALAAIATTGAVFVSRGDESGTHFKEIALWAAAGFDPADFGSWYRSVGAGMGASLNAASGMDAYILADRASWLNFGNKGGLALLYSGDPELFNQYAFLPVNPGRHPHVKSGEVQRFEEWLAGSRAGELIGGYKIGGEQLFVHNAIRE